MNISTNEDSDSSFLNESSLMEYENRKTRLKKLIRKKGKASSGLREVKPELFKKIQLARRKVLHER